MDRPTERGQPVLVLLGPTAAGKTSVAIDLAIRLPGEVISADSRAFFAGLDIVTDKPSEAERFGVLHHLIDIASVGRTYDAMAFRRDVARLVPEIGDRARVPVVAGGGTVYLGAILRGIFEGPAKDDAVREDLSKRRIEEMYERLREIDPTAASKIHSNDRLRITRALEVHTLTGRPISAWQTEAEPLPFRFFVTGLQRDRSDHRAAIAARVQRMIDRGLLNEVQRLLDEGLDASCQAYRTIGVPEAIACLEGQVTEDEMKQRMIHRTWALARKQMAFFRRESDVHWCDVTGRTASEVAREILMAWERFTEANDA